MGSVLLRGGVIADVAAHRTVRADVLIEDGRIRDLLTPDDHPISAAEIIDVSGSVVTPGLVNAHSHSYGPLVRHVGQGLPLEPWMMYSWANTVGRTPEEAYLSATLQGIEALKTGTTTMLDHLGGDIAVLSAALTAYEDLGIRAVMAPMISDIGLAETVGVPPRDWPPAARADDTALRPPPARDQLAWTEELHASWHGRADRLSVFLGPSAPQRCSTSMLEQVAELADRLDVGVHTHLLESRTQAAVPPPHGEKSWVTALGTVGLLTPRLSVAHAVWLDDADLTQLAETGVTIVHNPQSNLQLGSGFGQLPKWRKNGIPVALGTDGVNCGGSMDMLNSLRLAAVMHRPGLADPQDWETPWSVLNAATRGGAQALSIPDIGAIAIGMRADLAVFDTSGTAFASHDDPISSLVLSSYDHRARLVMVGGRVVVRDGTVQTLDEQSTIDKAAHAHRRLLARNQPYSQLARAQEMFLTQLSATAPATRAIITFEAPAPRTR
ncbi:MAG: hypothetical protein QOF99_922 [Pseudonocardiales bacterium]|jgi:5-methylthioadenosine/S-adenosylhomocysteine deaminase|nr:hypothetical protein [Pseudonocardiales bacterium]